MAEPFSSRGVAQRLPRNTIQTAHVAATAQHTSPFTPRDGVPTVWAAPMRSRSSSVPRVASAQGLSSASMHPAGTSTATAGTTVYFTSGATTPRPMPVPLPYMRPVPTAPMAHPVQHPGQFVRLDPDHSGVMNGARGNNSGELQKVREEFEAKMGEMQRRWEERFCEAIDFWHQAWSTTTAVVKDCNTHCVKLSEVLEASLDQLGQKSLEVANLQTRVRVLEAAASGDVTSPKNAPLETSPMSCAGTSDSFKKLSEELASFADYVSEQSARMRGDLTRVPGEGLGPPEAPCGAGALPRGEDGEEDKPSMSDWR